MPYIPINAPSAPAPLGGYAQAALVGRPGDWLIISGQIPENGSGQIPQSFEEQAALAWSNVTAQLEAAEMGIENLVKVTTFLSSREYNRENRRARQRALGGHTPALTVVVAGIVDERWLLEIEGLAAR